MSAFLLRFPRTVAAGAGLSMILSGAIAQVLSGSPTAVGTSTAQPGYSGVISINGTSWVNGSAGAGSIIIPQGVNLSGLEDSCAQGNPAWYGQPPPYSTLKTWGGNYVRIPLNAASFLGLNTCQINSSGNGWVSTTAAGTNYGGTYIAAVDAAIAGAQAIGCYVILDLHWSAPQFTFNGITRYATPLGQPPFMNSATDLAFWQAVATRYGTNVAPQSGINNNGIIFELFNEPFIDQLGGSYGNNTLTWGLMKNGGSVSLWNSAFYAVGALTVNQAWTALGYQQVLNQIRSQGANNAIIANGCGYSNASSGFAYFRPVDTLTPSQVAIGQHTYPSGTYPNDVYPNVFPDNNSGNASWSAGALAVLAAGLPWIITEDGDQYGPAATSGAPHTTYMLNFAAQYKVGYISWQFWPSVDSAGAPASGQNYDLANGQPTQGQGITVYNAFTAVVGGITVEAPTISPSSGTFTGAQTVSLSDTTSGASMFYTLDGSAPTASSTPYTGPFSVSSSVTVKVIATLSGATSSAVAVATYTVSSQTGSPAAPTNVMMILQGQTQANSTSSPPSPSAPNVTAISWSAAVPGTYPIASYKIYRSTTSASAGFNLLASPSGLGTSYVDNAATNSVNGTAGSSMPYYRATTYWYKVSAVDTHGTEGPLSVTQSALLYSNGTNYWGGNFNNGLTETDNDTAGGWPGGVQDMKCQPTTAYGELLYYSGGLYTQWNMWVGAFQFIQFDLKPMTGALQLQMYALRSGDVQIYNSSGSSYNINPMASKYGPTPQVGVIGTYKIPLADFLTDYGPSGAGPATVENAFYKFAIQDQTGNPANGWYLNNIKLVPS
jgi:hypothetical protein